MYVIRQIGNSRNIFIASSNHEADVLEVGLTNLLDVLDIFFGSNGHNHLWTTFGGESQRKNLDIFGFVGRHIFGIAYQLVVKMKLGAGGISEVFFGRFERLGYNSM